MAVPSVPPTGERASLIGGRYQVVRLLGQGGMGAVYHAQDRATGRAVAIKRLPSDANAASHTLFEREFGVLSGLRHPCIVEVYDYGTDEGGSYYTMELLPGQDLSKRAPISWRKACAYLRDAAAILGLLHARQLLHRDLSPRNLLESASGRLKLIDFGALASFGPATELVGTPPFVAPEAYRGAPLDQRSDLFSLGALGYWLLTGAHAFPARSLAELPQLWPREPIPASRMAAAIGGDLLEPVPPELDELLAALLRIDPNERPRDTAELIDRLNLIAELPPEAEEIASAGYLASKAFVGREREHERFNNALAEARSGHGRVLLLEGDAGVGRSRFLSELALTARLTGALTLELDATRERAPYAAAETLLVHLLRAHSEAARAAIGARAPLLSRISTRLRKQLATGRLSEPAQSAAEERALLQNALLETLLALARTRLVALFIDDLQAIDKESQALFAALAHACGEVRLCLTASVARDAGQQSSPELTSLRGVATRVRMLPLTGEQTHALLRSVFGSVRYLERLTERLFRAAAGNPAHTLELAQHLVDNGLAHYHDGGWELPLELAPDILPASRQAGLLARLDRLPAEARALARGISVRHAGVWSLPLVCAASELPEARARELLALLERERVLLALENGHRFAHHQLREKLVSELEPAPVHARVARAILAEHRDIDNKLIACQHFLRAGEPNQAYPLIADTLRFYSGGDITSLSTHARLLEEVHLLLVAAKAPEHVHTGPLALLATAGYYTDRRYAERYGELAHAALQRTLKMDLARKLTPRIGAKLALIWALAMAGFALLLRRPRLISIRQAIRWQLAAGASLTAAFSTCLDGERAMRYVRGIEPFAVLGPDHGATLAYELSLMIACSSSDLSAQAEQLLRKLFARLDDPRPIRQMPGNARGHSYAACMVIRGMHASWRDDPSTLAIADQLERFSPLHAMSADQLRADFYGGQGQLDQARHWRRKLEQHAVQLGSAWQVETWSPIAAISHSARTLDASAMKHTAQDLDRLSISMPSMQIHAQQARAAYLLLRGKAERALAVLEPIASEHERPMAWLRMRGLLAQAYNQLGQHQRAREICQHALANCDREQLSMPILSLNTQLQLALAESGLGQHQSAELLLKQLFTAHLPQQSAITLAMLHDVGAQLALARGDLARAREHHTIATVLVKPLALPGWSERLRAIARAIARMENPAAELEKDHQVLDDVNHMMKRVQLMLSTRTGDLVGARARSGLQVALELSSANEGFVILSGSERAPIAHLGSAQPSSELISWAAQSLAEASVDAETVLSEDIPSTFESNCKAVGSVRYLVAPLWATKQGQECAVAALVLGFDDRVPRMPEPQVLSAIAAHLLA